MKKLIFLAFLPAVSFASAKDALMDLKFEGTDEVCAKIIGKAVYKAAAKQFGKDTAETISIVSVKPVTTFDDSTIVTPYFVTVSDEVEPSQWLVVAETEDCVIEYVGQSK